MKNYTEFSRSHLRHTPSLKPSPNYIGAKDSCDTHLPMSPHESLLPVMMEASLNTATAAMTPVQMVRSVK